MGILKRTVKDIDGRMSAEALFMVGTATTTPDLFDVEAVWPRPWRFLATLAFALSLYGLFYAGMHFFNNERMMPGVIFTGSFAVPVSALVLFFELNIRRNISLYRVVTLVLGGGVLSMLLSLFLLYFDNYALCVLNIPDAWQDSARGLVEEIAKLAVAVLFVYKARYRFLLNGLLIGAAVGVGFSAFESAGYALSDCLVAVAVGGRSLDCLQNAMSVTEASLVTRGLLSPLGHIVWSAIACAGLWWAKGNGQLSIRMFLKWRFLLMFVVASMLHSLWNSPVELPFYCKYLTLGGIAWVIVVVFVNMGIRQVLNEQKAVLEKIS